MKRAGRIRRCQRGGGCGQTRLISARRTDDYGAEVAAAAMAAMASKAERRLGLVVEIENGPDLNSETCVKCRLYSSETIQGS